MVRQNLRAEGYVKEKIVGYSSGMLNWVCYISITFSVLHNYFVKPNGVVSNDKLIHVTDQYIVLKRGITVE